ncbi:MAG: YHYH protein [Crocinitomicaceae bacterium]
MVKYLIGFLFLGIIYSCATRRNVQNETSNSGNSDKTNVLLIIADDLGSDAFSTYNIGKEKPNMPNIEKLANTGVRFTNCWAYPTCTPTRSSIITGKHSFRTNMVQVGDELSTNEVSLQRYINENSQKDYNCAVIGKWHLSESADHPSQMKVPYYSGLLSGGVKDYNSWKHTFEGKTTRVNEYITSYFTDNAIEWINAQNDDNPWFLWLAYTAPHTPFHLPPTNLHSADNLSTDSSAISSNPQPYFFSMIEALDTEVGRLLDAIPDDELENTVIIFIGDNGTPNQVVQRYGKRKAKGSIYQGGINVPLVISGKNVKRVNEIEEALTNSTDLFATIAELTGTGTSEINDSKSLVPLLTKDKASHKDYLYSELGKKNKNGKAIRNASHKYIIYTDGSEELYDLTNDPYEQENLISNGSDQDQLNDLKNALNELLGSANSTTGTTATSTFSVSNGIACTQDLSLQNTVAIFPQNQMRIIQSNGVPNHSIGPFPNSGNPHTLSAQNINYQVQLNPVKANSMTSLYSESGFGIGRPDYEFGVAINGIKLDPSAAEAFTNPQTKEKNFDWVKEALSVNNRLGDDCNNAHVQPNGEYHYHGTPWGIVNDANGGSMFLTGWAADGFPIYYKWGHQDPMDANSSLIELTSSYSLRQGSRPGDGKTTPDGAYDGTYVRDYVYITGSGTLDEANGRFGVTPEFPQGTYYYVITDEFPSVPRFFVGTPDPSFKVGGGHSQTGGNPSNPEGGSNEDELLRRFNKMDANKDGKIARSEARGPLGDRFDQKDTNGDGYLSKEEFMKRR